MFIFDGPAACQSCVCGLSVSMVSDVSSCEYICLFGPFRTSNEAEGSPPPPFVKAPIEYVDGLLAALALRSDRVESWLKLPESSLVWLLVMKNVGVNWLSL